MEKCDRLTVICLLWAIWRLWRSPRCWKCAIAFEPEGHWFPVLGNFLSKMLHLPLQKVYHDLILYWSHLRRPTCRRPAAEFCLWKFGNAPRMLPNTSFNSKAFLFQPWIENIFFFFAWMFLDKTSHAGYLKTNALFVPGLLFVRSFLSDTSAFFLNVSPSFVYGVFPAAPLLMINC